MKYTVETLSRRDMRKCYSRFSIAVILYLAAIEGCAILLVLGAVRFLPDYLSDASWYPIIQVVINDIAVYLPGFVLVPLLLRKLPRAPKMPVDRLTLGEFVQAAMFSVGTAYLFSGLTTLLVYFLEDSTGMESSNVLESFSSGLPEWLVIVAMVLVAPVCEELIFRKLMLEPLRALGDSAAVLLTALAFALFHMNLYQILYAFFAGLVFGCVVLLTGSIRDAILLHMLVNGFSLLFEVDGPDIYWIIVGFVLLVCILSVPYFLVKSIGRYHMEPGPLPFKKEEKIRACLMSVWFWIMLLGGTALSVIVIFL